MGQLTLIRHVSYDVAMKRRVNTAHLHCHDRMTCLHYQLLTEERAYELRGEQRRRNDAHFIE